MTWLARMVFDQSRATSSTCFSFVALHPHSQAAAVIAARKALQTRKCSSCNRRVALRLIVSPTGCLSLLFMFISQVLSRDHACRDSECSKSITRLTSVIFQNSAENSARDVSGERSECVAAYLKSVMATETQGIVSKVHEGVTGAVKALFDALRRGKAQWVTVIVLLLPVGWYVLSYLPQQRDRFTERNIRQLNVASYELESKIDSSIRALTTLASSAFWHSPDSPSNWIANAIALSPGLDLDRVTINDTTNKPSRATVDVRYVPEDGVRFDCQSIIGGSSGSSNRSVQIVARRKFQNLFAESAEREEFNIVLLADNDGKVICQRSAPGWTALNLKELPTVAGHTLETNVKRGLSFVADVRCANTSYKVFAQPTRVPETNEQALATLWLVGLVESKLFLLETLAISHRALAHLGLLTLAVFAIMPFFKLQFLGAHIPLRRGDGYAVGAAAVMITGLLSFCLLDFCAHHHRKENFNNDLRMLGRQISTNLIAEISDSQRILERLNRIAVQGAHFPEAVISNGSRRLLYATNVLDDPAIAREFGDRAYPGFDMVSWMDSAGRQYRKWTVKRSPTPFITLKWRNYFTDALNERRSAYEYRNGTNRCWVEPVVSANTGERSVAVALPYQGGVAALDVKFISVIRPSLPPNCGFAVVAPGGLALLHSDPARNLRENIIQECNYDAHLRAALLGGSGKPFDIRYQGKPHSFYVTSLPGLTWSLIVFREASIVNQASFDVLWVSLIFFGIYFVLLCLVWWILRLPSPHRTAWIWPAPGKQSACVDAVGTGVLIVALFLVCTVFSKRFGISPLVLASFSLLFPLLGGIAYCYFMKRKRRCELQRHRGGGASFTAALVSLLLLLGAVPAFALFKLAHDIQMVSMIKQTQLQMAKRLDEHEARMENDYRQSFRNSENLGKWRNHRKLNPEEQRDRYIGCAFSTTLELPDRHSERPTLSLGDRFESFVAFLCPMHHRTAGRKTEVFREDTVNEKWSWEQKPRKRGDESREILCLSNRNDPTFPQIVSFIPTFNPVWWTPLLPLVLFCFVCWIACFIARRLFASEVKPVRFDDGGDPVLMPHRLEIVPTGTVCSHPWADDISSTHLDFRNSAEWEPWRTAPAGRALSTVPQRVVIRNLDFGHDDPKINLQKIELLEKLVADGRFPVMVVSAVHPEHFRFNAPAANEQDFQTRWLSLFETFAVGYGKRSSEPKSGLNPAKYQLIWASCSREEQLALYQLASHGLINSRSDALPLLLARGLVVSTPKLEVRPSSFAAYVRKVFRVEDLRANEAEELACGWKVMKKVVWIVICAALLFFFLTQREQFTATIGLLTAFTTGIPAFLKFFGVFRTQGTQ
jgi:hypothetical protein